jgi:lauroyl/myristoyl acyltransferase
VETVLRPSRASTIKDAAAYLKVLKSGKLLAITPDILADPEQGVETRIFGRPARLHGGAFALAISARAPLIRACYRWQSTSRVLVMFDRAPLHLDASDRDASIRAAVHNWCQWFEEKLRANPENWQLWLDKRWSRFLRATPRVPGAE